MTRRQKHAAWARRMKAIRFAGRCERVATMIGLGCGVYGHNRPPGMWVRGSGLGEPSLAFVPPKVAAYMAKHPPVRATPPQSIGEWFMRMGGVAEDIVLDDRRMGIAGRPTRGPSGTIVGQWRTG